MELSRFWTLDFEFDIQQWDVVISPIFILVNAQIHPTPFQFHKCKQSQIRVSLTLTLTLTLFQSYYFHRSFIVVL